MFLNCFVHIISTTMYVNSPTLFLFVNFFIIIQNNTSRYMYSIEIEHSKCWFIDCAKKNIFKFMKLVLDNIRDDRK